MAEIIIYHKNFKILHREKFTKKRSLDYFMDCGSQLIINGMKDNIPIKRQLLIYRYFVKKIQELKIYKLSKEDKELYIGTVIALVKLGIYDFDDEDSPIYIAPKRKIKRIKT